MDQHVQVVLTFLKNQLLFNAQNAGAEFALLNMFNCLLVDFIDFPCNQMSVQVL